MCPLHYFSFFSALYLLSKNAKNVLSLELGDLSSGALKCTMVENLHIKWWFKSK